MARRIGTVVGVVLLAVAAVVAVRTAGLRSAQVPPSGQPLVEVDEDAAAARLAAALRIATVSRQEGPPEAETLRELHDHLRSAYPTLHERLRRETIGGSLLYTWPGADPQAPPLVLTGHLDVVPVEGPERWQRPPFSGEIADGFVWGRGALDDKAAVLAICEAVETLLRAGFVPARTVHLAFGHDEERGGAEGAARIAALLAERGVRPLLVLDEGLVIVDGIVPGIDGPVALVGVAEKGSMSLELTVAEPGGHSSMPASTSSIGILSAALVRLEQEPMPARLEGVARSTFLHLAPEMPLVPRAVFANLWLTAPLVRRQLASSPTSAALLRTTTALTIVRAGEKENVIPGSARAVANFRLLPGDTPADVLEHVRRVVADERVRIRELALPETASAVAPAEGPAFRAVAQAVRDVVPGVVVAPGLVLGGTDGRHYERLGGPVYRFAPYRFAPGDLARVHGTDERVATSAQATAVRVYARLLRLAAGA